jgi:hypothetical protein
MIKLELTEENTVGKLPLFSGVRDLLIAGEGSVRLERTFDGLKYYPLTDNVGNIVPNLVSKTGVMFNAQIENNSRGLQLRIVLLHGHAKVEMS